MAKAKSPVNPFASAKAATPAAAKSKSPVIVAADYVNPFTGTVDAKRDEVALCLQNYCEGDRLASEGEAMMTANRPLILGFARASFAGMWLREGKLPDNPKIVEKADGTGAMLGVAFVDREVNIAEAEVADLANLIGAAVVQQNLTIRDEFSLNPAMMDQEIAIKDAKGTPQKKRVMDHIADALMEKFHDNPDVLAGLFTIKPIQKTAKGLIGKGLALTGANMSDPKAASKLVDFLIKTKVVTQLKPGKLG